MALLASLLIMPSCKKESKTDPTPTPDPVVKNPLIEYYDLGRAICYVDTITVYEKLDKDGWTIVQDDSVRVYTKLDGNNISLELSIRNEDGVIYAVAVELIDQNVNAALINAEAFKGCMSHIGDSTTIAGVNFSFKGMLYFGGGNNNYETDYTKALDLVLECYSYEYIGPMWGSSESHAILLSKMTEKGKDIIHIAIG